jgi:hypothetical protein
MASTAILQTADHNEDFRNARHEFLNQLAEGDRAEFYNVDGPEDLMQEIERLTSSFRDRQKVKKMLRMADGLNDRLTPYFEALGLIAQGSSGYAAVVWGAFRLVLKVFNHICIID